MATPGNLRIGLFGAGIVGGGICELIQKHTANGRFEKLGVSMEIVKICVRSPESERDFKSSRSYVYVSDRNEILNDESINCVVEVMGGTTDAKDIVLAAIRAGKHIVSANKALIANHLEEIQAALTANPSVLFNYEAAVCGGIPVITTLQTGFPADEITKIMGIMNGTTNFMLCKMEDEGADYSAVLQEAQRLGFAEADPTADVEGHDVQAKIALLAKLAFGKTIPVSSVHTSGISKITSVDFEYAKILKSTIKLLGTAIMSETANADGSTRKSLAVFVSPTVVSLSSAIASAKGPGNIVAINSANMGLSTLSGPGAGRYPTANSILSDLVRTAQGRTPAAFPLEAEAGVEIDGNYESKFYVRIRCSDGLGIIRAVGAAAEAAGVSIYAIHRNPVICATGDIAFVVVTEVASFKSVQDFAQRVSELPLSKDLPLVMPMI